MKEDEEEQDLVGAPGSVDPFRGILASCIVPGRCQV